MGTDDFARLEQRIATVEAQLSRSTPHRLIGAAEERDRWLERQLTELATAVAALRQDTVDLGRRVWWIMGAAGAAGAGLGSVAASWLGP